MRLAMFVNTIAGEVPKYTTTLLAREATRRGHEVFYVEADGFEHTPEDGLRLRVRVAPTEGDLELEEYLEHVQAKDSPEEWIAASDLDVLMLRSDPAQEVGSRPWAQNTGILFGQMAAAGGTLVVNDPRGLSVALNKLYFQYFPEEVRPKSLITRSPEEIKRFIAGHGDRVVLKPLHGSGGQSVFLVRPDDKANQNQMIEAVLRDGYVIVQEYLPAAAEGDIRFFLLDGEPLVYQGKHAAFRRVSGGGDMRSNMHAGGKAKKVKVDDRLLEIAALVGPKLKKDGMFLVGLDVAGDKLMEINVFSPGGLNSAGHLAGAAFEERVVDALEAKVATSGRYPGQFSNAELATL